MGYDSALVSRRFIYYVWVTLLFTVLVILWGALVRATGSGAGCGSHWPLCNGALLPDIPHQSTFIEFFHRVTSGLALLLVVGLVVWAVRVLPKGDAVRWAAWVALFFMITESLIGAALVLFELVGENSSVARAIWMALHLGNTFLLLTPLTLMAWWCSGGSVVRDSPDRLLLLLLGGGLLGTLLLGMTGAIAALGSTLFPARSLQEGLQQDFAASAHFLIRLRILHPLVAIGMTAYLMTIAWVVHRYVPATATRRLAITNIALFGVQLAIGGMNVFLMAPLWMQLVHLLLALIIWMTMVLLTIEALALPMPHRVRRTSVPAPVSR